MKIKEIRTEIDEQGEKKVIEQSNGVCIKLLKKPSDEYKIKLAQRAKKEKERIKKENENQEREKMIQEQMRKIAIEQLEKEGKM